LSTENISWYNEGGCRFGCLNWNMYCPVELLIQTSNITVVLSKVKYLFSFEIKKIAHFKVDVLSGLELNNILNTKYCWLYNIDNW